MPIEFAPPSSAVQGLNVPPPQYADPLQTLAQFGQLRAQNLQAKEAGMNIQQMQMELASNKALLAAMANPANVNAAGQPDFDRIYNDAASSGDVMPGALFSLKQHQNQLMSEKLGLDERTRALLQKDNERYRSMLLSGNVTDQPSLEAVNTQADREQIDPRVARLRQFTDPTHVTAFATGLGLHAGILGEKKTQAEIDKATEEAAAAKAMAAKTGMQTQELEQTATVRDILAAPLDANGQIPISAWNRIRTDHPKVALPDVPNTQYIDRIVRAELAKDPAKLAEYDIRQRALKMTPEQWHQSIDRIIPKTGNTVALNARTHEQVADAIGLGDVNRAQAIIKDASDQIGRTETGVRTAEATKPIKIELAGAEQAARNAAGMPGVPNASQPSQLHGEEYLKTLPPAFAARVRNIAAGGEPAPTGRAAMSGPGLQLMNAVYQYDPEFTTLLAQQRKQTLSEYTSTSNSKAGGQLLALNTLIHHADLYLETGAALKNGTFRPGNAAYNAVQDAFGKAPPTNAALVGRFLAGETGKVATGGVPAEGEINGILAKLGTDASPEQIAGAGNTIMQIAAGRMVPLRERVRAAKLESFVQVLGPHAQQILARRGYDPETMQPGAKPQQLPIVRVQSEFDALPPGAPYINAEDGKQYSKPRK